MKQNNQARLIFQMDVFNVPETVEVLEMILKNRNALFLQKTRFTPIEPISAECFFALSVLNVLVCFSLLTNKHSQLATTNDEKVSGLPKLYASMF